MKLSTVFCASLMALALSSTASFAAPGDPIIGVPIGLEGDPGSIVIAHGVTDSDGKIDFGKLAPGKYVAVIEGKRLVAAIDRLAPSTPAKKTSSSSFDVGVGGMFGGGSSRRHASDRKADPIDAAHGNSRSNGGTEAGIVVVTATSVQDPTTVVRPGGHGNQQGTITYTITVSPQPESAALGREPDAPGWNFSSETPYHRADAAQGMRIAFTVQKRGAYTARINWGDGSTEAQGIGPVKTRTASITRAHPNRVDCAGNDKECRLGCDNVGGWGGWQNTPYNQVPYPVLVARLNCLGDCTKSDKLCEGS